MYTVESKAGAIGCILAALFFIGTWPAVFAYRERRGRLPQHTFLDFAVAKLLFAVFIVLTAGQIGHNKSGKPNFLAQLSHQMDEIWPSVLFAMASGVVLSIGNVLTQYAWALVNLSIVEVVSSSIAVMIGTTFNYFLDRSMNKAEILFPGLGCFLVAVLLGSALHISNTADNREKFRSLPTELEEGAGSKDILASKAMSMNNDIQTANETDGKLHPGAASYLIQLEQERSVKVFGKSTWIGLAQTMVAGCCFGLFSPFFNLSTNDQLHVLKKGAPHPIVYISFFYFTASWFMLSVIVNVTFLYRPILGLPKSSLSAYLKDWEGRGWALLAGVMCACGNGLQFIGGQAAGYTTANADQAFPLVSTFWGILVFKEYRRSSRKTYILLVSMLSMFVIAVGLFLGSSARIRKA